MYLKVNVLWEIIPLSFLFLVIHWSTQDALSCHRILPSMRPLMLASSKGRLSFEAALVCLGVEVMIWADLRCALIGAFWASCSMVSSRVPCSFSSSTFGRYSLTSFLRGFKWTVWAHNDMTLYYIEMILTEKWLGVLQSGDISSVYKHKTVA